MEDFKKDNKYEKEIRYPKFDPLGENEQPVYRSVGAMDRDGKPIFRSVMTMECGGNEYFKRGSSISSSCEPSNFKIVLENPKPKYRCLKENTPSIQEAPLMNKEKEVNVPELPAAPFPVDYYHFHCRLSADSLVEKLNVILQECGVDWEFNSEKCKFKCVKYMDYDSLTFVVRLYTSSQPDVFLVEFQRRTGNILTWDHFYGKIYRMMLDCIDTLAPASPQSGGQKKVAHCTSSKEDLQYSWGSQSNDNTVSAVSPIIAMVNSKYLDVQREGCVALATLSENNENVKLCVREGALDALIPKFKSNDVNIRRYAASIIANISKAVSSLNDEELVEMTKEALTLIVSDIIKTFTSFQTSQFLELQRECARALLYLSKLCHEEIIRQGGLKILQQQNSWNDERLATHFKDTYANLC